MTQDRPPAPPLSLEESNWSEAVANDPKHRPQDFDRLSTTVRREWCRRPQEAHVAVDNRYRRLSVAEIAAIQGFPVDWVEIETLTENEKIACLGNAVSPPVSVAIAEVIQEHLDFSSQTLIEICAGIGGLSYGFDYLESLAYIETWEPARRVLIERVSSSPDKVFEIPAQEFDFGQHLGNVGLLCGGPPCQPWSLAGRREGEEDERDVMGATPDFVAACQPDAFLFENVPGILFAKDNASYLENLTNRLSNAGESNYGVSFIILNAADFGVPQVRKRVFILGVKDKKKRDVASILAEVEKSAPFADPKKSAYGKKPWVNLGAALKGVASNETWRLLPTKTEATSVDDLDTGTVKQPPEATVFREDSTPINRIALRWPNDDKRVTLVEGKWQFERRDLGVRERALEFDENSNPNYPQNGIVVKGEHLGTLRALKRTIGRAVDLFYIDAPRRTTLEREAPPGLVDSVWLSLLKEQAVLAKGVMKKPGYFAVHVEESYFHYARGVLDEVFGNASHVTTFAWQKKYGPQNDRNTPTDAFDQIIVYSSEVASLLPKIRILRTPGKILDDGDYRGPFEADHKGAKSGSEETKFRVNVPPYHWEVEGLDQLSDTNFSFDSMTGTLWIEKLPPIKQIKLTAIAEDEKGKKSQGSVTINISSLVTETPSSTIPWLFKTNERQGDSRSELSVITQKIDARPNNPLSVVFLASGGKRFKGKNDAPGSGRYWEFSKSTLEAALLESRVRFGTKGTSLPAIKKFLDASDTRRGMAVTNWLPTWDKKGKVLFGKSEDATKHLRNLANEGIINNSFRMISKPERLLHFLLELFVPENGTVMTFGDVNASMAAVALKVNKRFIHLVGHSDNDIQSWNDVGEKRLRHVASGEDRNIDDDLSIEVSTDKCSFDLLSLSDTAIYHQPKTGIIRLDKGTPNDKNKSFYAAFLGYYKVKDTTLNEYENLEGKTCVLIDSGEILDSTLAANFSGTLDNQITIVAERVDLDESDFPNVKVLRAPYELLGYIT